MAQKDVRLASEVGVGMFGSSCVGDAGGCGASCKLSMIPGAQLKSSLLSCELGLACILGHTGCCYKLFKWYISL